MVHYKLVYFNVRGRAEPSRLIFAQAGVQFDDVRLDGLEWASYKASQSETPFGQLPVLEVDGDIVAQSKAIARYLGNEFNMVPSNQFDIAKLDMLVEGLDDLGHKLRPYFKEKDTQKKQEIWSQLADEHLTPFLNKYQKFLIEGGSDFFISNDITWGDLAIFDRFYFLKSQSPEIFENFDAICQFINRISDLPAIKTWLEERPNTEM